MKRSGFTMIELIFVIVILGILAAVALPKFIGVSEQAQVGKVKAWVGTMNRTVAPGIWSESISQSLSGQVKTLSADAIAALEPLAGINDDGTNMPNPDLTQCAVAGTAIPNVGQGATGANTITSVTVGTKTYDIGCVDGDMTRAPQFWLEENGGKVIIK